MFQVCVEGRDTVPAVFLSPSSVPASPQRRKRRASPAGPFRSRMRRTNRHYTPHPILPPDREGSGLLIDFATGKSYTPVFQTFKSQLKLSILYTTYSHLFRTSYN